MLPTGSDHIDAQRAFARMVRSRRRAALTRSLRRRACGARLRVIADGELAGRRVPARGGTLEIPLDAIAGTLEPSRAQTFDERFRPPRRRRPALGACLVAEQRGAGPAADLRRAGRRRLRDPRRPSPRLLRPRARRADDRRERGDRLAERGRAAALLPAGQVAEPDSASRGSRRPRRRRARAAAAGRGASSAARIAAAALRGSPGWRAVRVVEGRRASARPCPRRRRSGDRCIAPPPNPVRNEPGSTIRTRMPNGATSAASASETPRGRTWPRSKRRSPARRACRPSSSSARSRRCRCARMCGSTACVSATAPKNIVSITARRSSGSISSTAPTEP